MVDFEKCACCPYNMGVDYCYCDLLEEQVNCNTVCPLSFGLFYTECDR